MDGYIITKEVFTHQEIFLSGEKRYVTVCTITSSQYICRGVSICCPQDQYCKRLGNRIARGRAMKAYVLGRNLNPIRQDKLDWRHHIPYIFKVEFTLNGENNR